MFCPQCGHQQVSNETHFCSRCGLSLVIVNDLLANSSNQLQREKREIMGIGLMIATVLMLLNFLFVFGIVTLPHLGNSVFLWLWIFFVLSCLVIGGFGLANLVRSGFFKRLKDRDARLRLMKAEAERQLLPEEHRRASFDVEHVSRISDRMSVTENTTRELRKDEGGRRNYEG